jgi:hypothetical protein
MKRRGVDRSGAKQILITQGGGSVVRLCIPIKGAIGLAG